MGALHDGHGALIRRMCDRGLPVVATIFVNPTQFAPREDFAKYPRTIARDVELAEACGADAVFAPTAETVYPLGLDAARAEAAAWLLPTVASQPGLEDASRPNHFGGVCQVVARLFDLTRPALAVFGEKDFQQLRVLTDMVGASRGRWGSLLVEAAPTVREHDGLAMSSRNRYLRPEQRDQALGLVRALHAAATETDPHSAETMMRSTLEAHGLTVDYAVVRHAATLLSQLSDGRYEEPVALLCKAAALLRRLGRSDDFAEQLAALRAQHKAKRNFTKLLDEKRAALA